jgi:hypothetical protein
VEFLPCQILGDQRSARCTGLGWATLSPPGRTGLHWPSHRPSPAWAVASDLAGSACLVAVDTASLQPTRATGPHAFPRRGCCDSYPRYARARCDGARALRAAGAAIAGSASGKADNGTVRDGPAGRGATDRVTFERVQSGCRLTAVESATRLPGLPSASGGRRPAPIRPRLPVDR